MDRTDESKLSIMPADPFIACLLRAARRGRELREQNEVTQPDAKVSEANAPGRAVDDSAKEQ